MIQIDFFGEDNTRFEHFCEKTKEIQNFTSKILYQTVSFFTERDYMLVEPPVLHEHIQNRKKGIPVSLCNKQYDLNASNALYISAYATIFGNVFAISPTFRKEKQSNNHLIEFRMLECESSNSDFQQCIELMQNYIRFILKAMTEQFTGSVFEKRLNSLQENLKFDTVTYKELISILKTNAVSIDYGDDLSDCDLEVSSILHNPTFVIDYPHPPATWTALPKNDVTYTFNFLLPNGFGELAEGGQRNNDYTFFQEKFKKPGLEKLTWYADAIKKNPCIRSGFGLGIERLVAWLIGLTNIRETVLFYREGA
jgi:asparaginyl-tRNA synthetase